ncbi:MAG: PadR family transcriptional regulator [Nanoarchaeota archaeon]|nr:PadR family transcriptional regulator [Nanoarchaeota archaeon]MBU4299990.1 PadR family transcriptional regulator [Nanoarchaeota archaeon]MBU4451222.1 PadR family transcriptional regulator [Nanoarchaeota archaeon]MCG2724084.1 PadR family transcriptional regulator [archaeon]
MIGLWNTSGKKKCGSILTIYVLQSLDKKPKSGYELLSEIREKTGGKWAPSKGTLYPILGQLQKQKLIEISKTGKRAKNIFRVTSAGKTSLSELGKKRKEWRENFLKFRNLFADILGEERAEVSSLIFEIKDAALRLSEEKKKEVAARALEKCLLELKNLEGKNL